MTSLEPMKLNNIDLNNIQYKKIKKNNNKKIILLKYNDNNKIKNFVFQSPTLINLNKPTIHNDYAEIEILLEGKNSNKINYFKLFLNNIENKIKVDASTYANEWFNVNENNSTINFQKIIRENNIFKIKIIKNIDFETIVQLNNLKKISYNLIPEDSWCKLILECYAIWINSNNDFGIFFRPVLISFKLKEKKIYNYNFIEDSDSENNIDIPDTDCKNYKDSLVSNIYSKNLLQDEFIIKTLNESKNDNNLFMEVPINKLINNNNSTSQLDLNELSNLKYNNTETSISDNKNILKIPNNLIDKISLTSSESNDDDGDDSDN
jgi:hypothetical protein